MTRICRTAGTVACALLALVGAACSGGDEPAAGTDSGAIVAPDAEAAGPEVTEPREAEGDMVNRLALEVGWCFNDYRVTLGVNEEESSFTTRLDCARPHDGEVYASHAHPGDATAPFPGRTALEQWATKACYKDFARWVGLDYEHSELELGVTLPTEETWTNPQGRHRGVACYVRGPDGTQLLGSMQQSAV